MGIGNNTAEAAADSHNDVCCAFYVLSEFIPIPTTSRGGWASSFLMIFGPFIQFDCVWCARWEKYSTFVLSTIHKNFNLINISKKENWAVAVVQLNLDVDICG